LRRIKPASRAGGEHRCMHDAKTQRIMILVGHPDPAEGRLCRALAQAYADGAHKAGHEVETIDLAQFEVPLLRSAHEWQTEPVPAALAPVQDALMRCQHLVIVFPLWMGDMPAMLKAFIEQVARPGWAFPKGAGGPLGAKALKGRSARVVVTMGMPALVYRYFFRAHSVKALERNILGFIGFGPIHETLFGNVEGASADTRAGWLATMAKLGAQAR
jgi:putative NADPH-quinone reductase